MPPMKGTFFLMLAAVSLAFCLTGCVSTVDGRTKTAWPLQRDTIESRYERPAEQVFSAAREVLQFNGSLYGENTVTKTLEAKVDTSTVWVKVEQADPRVTRVLVQARTKGGGGDIALASEMDKQIALRLTQK